MIKFIYEKRLLFILLFILFLFVFSSNTYANFFNGDPEIVDKLNSAFEKIGIINKIVLKSCGNSF